MQVDIDIWIQQYLSKLKDLFGSRLAFVGLQGSYGRGEAINSSDIDMVVILDHTEPEDLKEYATMLDSFPNREKICGFISGLQELKNWERSDLFQFYYDTTPILGQIDFLPKLIGEEDVRRAIRIGVCNIYHMCGHNMVYERDSKVLKALYKSAVFTIHAISYLQMGTYRKRETELLPVLQQPERKILEAAIAIKQQTDLTQVDFDRLSEQLFLWASRLITEYQPDETKSHFESGYPDA
ncbi:MAG: nucleotidyltransferase domain-containing protein [Oscillospiraceae bacterium]|nr:nucleotidyltransferase domain-containing protein [Oscillospiraceae bacterium]